MKHKTGLADFERDELVIGDIFHLFVNLALASEIIRSFTIYSPSEKYTVRYQRNIYYLFIYLFLSIIKFNFHASSLEATFFFEQGSVTYH